MSDVTIPLTVDVARAIVLGIAREQNSYNKAWSWWAHDADDDVTYKFGELEVSLTQRVFPDTDSYGEYHGDTDIEMVFMIGGSRYFRITGEYSSYGGSSEGWSEGSFREVRPTKVTRQVFDFV